MRRGSQIRAVPRDVVSGIYAGDARCDLFSSFFFPYNMNNLPSPPPPLPHFFRLNVYHVDRIRNGMRKANRKYIYPEAGVAQGAGVPVESILALNVRTEIAYGMFSDGCTALSWKSKDESFLAQNWDVSSLLFSLRFPLYKTATSP